MRVGYFEQYAFIGPALAEMRLFPESVLLVCYSSTNSPAEPYEVWCPINHTWVRLDGQWISGWRDDSYFGFRPSFWNRLKIRMAARAWRRASLQENGDGR